MLDQEILNRNRNINRGYRKLEVWQEGIELFVLVRTKLKSIDSVSFKVKAQIEDSALSCPSNIAEGYSRRSIKENINFVNIALASLSENYTQLFALHSSDDLDKAWFDEYDKKHYSLENKLIQFNKSMILKLDSNGNTNWLILLDNNIPDLGAMEPLTILSTSSANVVLAGLFDNTVDFDPGPGVTTLTSFETTSGVFDDDGFIVSYDSSGNFRWVHHVGGGTSDEIVFSLAENSDGDVFATGDGNTGFFLTKLEAHTGTSLALYEEGLDIAFGYEAVISPSNNMYLTGKVFQDSIDVDFGNTNHFIVFYPNSSGDESLFLAKYNASQVPTGVRNDTEGTIPSEFQLEQNYPNPFNPSTQINFSIPDKSFVTLKVYNIQGEEVATLIQEELLAGIFSVEWSAANLPSGVYVYSMIANNKVQSRKMILLR